MPNKSVCSDVNLDFGITHTLANRAGPGLKNYAKYEQVTLILAMMLLLHVNIRAYEISIKKKEHHKLQWAKIENHLRLIPETFGNM